MNIPKISDERRAVGAFVHAARMRAGLSRRALAFRANFSSSWVGQIETGHSRLHPDGYRLITAALEMTDVEAAELKDLVVTEFESRWVFAEPSGNTQRALRAPW
ncbi:transcriptional regulator with XRE-family HTH domain [Mycobacteroides chelonae]|nr:transcriptional regulator with XRE-family HTH domain [Mycobacteroides chelonae]